MCHLFQLLELGRFCVVSFYNGPIDRTICVLMTLFLENCFSLIEKKNAPLSQGVLATKVVFVLPTPIRPAHHFGEQIMRSLLLGVRAQRGGQVNVINHGC